MLRSNPSNGVHSMPTRRGVHSEQSQRDIEEEFKSFVVDRGCQACHTMGSRNGFD
jgi:hypothetical protein